MSDKKGEKRVRILLAVAVGLVVIAFALIFFKFPDNTHAKFIFSEPDADGCVKVLGYNGNPESLTIPSTDGKGHKVTVIARGAFGSGNTRLEEVKLPNSVLVIEEDAFHSVPNLEEVELSSKLKEIGDNAFAECHELEDIEFPKTLEKIGARAFYRCIELDRLYIPASVKEIGQEAFLSCESLILDVSDNELAADVAAQYHIEIGSIDTTMIYVIVIVAITVVGTVAVVFGWHHVRRRVKKKKDMTSSLEDKEA